MPGAYDRLPLVLSKPQSQIAATNVSSPGRNLRPSTPAIVCDAPPLSSRSQKIDAIMFFDAAPPIARGFEGRIDADGESAAGASDGKSFAR